MRYSAIHGCPRFSSRSVLDQIPAMTSLHWIPQVCWFREFFVGLRQVRRSAGGDLPLRFLPPFTSRSPLPLRSATPAIPAAGAQPVRREWPEGVVCGPRAPRIRPRDGCGPFCMQVIRAFRAAQRLRRARSRPSGRREGAARPEPGRTRPRNPVHPLPARRREAVARPQGGRASCSTSAGVR